MTFILILSDNNNLLNLAIYILDLIAIIRNFAKKNFLMQKNKHSCYKVTLGEIRINNVMNQLLFYGECILKQ